MLGCTIDITRKLLALSEKWVSKLHDTLNVVNPTTSHFLIRKWRWFLVILHSIVPDVPGARGMFMRLQHAMSSHHDQII